MKTHDTPFHHSNLECRQFRYRRLTIELKVQKLTDWYSESLNEA